METLKKMILTPDLRDLFDNHKGEIIMPETREELLALAMGNNDENDLFEVAYEVPEKGRTIEATVARCKNGLSVNYTTPYMRRRDPECMVIADDKPTDKPQYKNLYGESFDKTRKETFEWLKNEDIIVMPYMSGGAGLGYYSLLVAPANAGFFAGGTAKNPDATG